MGKKKNKGRRHLSDNVRTSKKGITEPKSNPFEVRINKQKHQILGRKISKYDRGLPGVSRGKAIKKRKETLLKEYQHRTKSNQFVDKRLGESDPNMSVEDKMMQRFAMERQKVHEKSVLYNLNEEETQLTHYGQSLADIEKQETILESDEEEDGEPGKFGEEDHFGGFLTKKKPDAEQEGQTKSRKEMLDDIIANSKKEKYERQHEKDELIGLTEELDKEWKSVSMLVAKGLKLSKDAEPSRKPDAYDMAVRELIFDMKASATDRLKTPEELAKEEKERLDALEADRQRRMKGIVDEEKPTHVSADDLNDGFDFSSAPEKMMLSYDDGKPSLDLRLSIKGGETEEDSEEDGDEGEDNGDGDEEEEEREEDEDNESEEEEDNHSDLESEEEDEESDEEDQDEPTKKTDKKSGHDKPKKKKNNIEEVQQAAKDELPYTYKAPEDYDEFQQLIGGQSSSNQAIIIERIRTCHHPSLAEGNTNKLETFFSILLQYFGEVARRHPLDMELLNHLTRHLHGLSQQSPLNAGHCMQTIIVERHQQFCKVAERRAGKPDFPSLDTLLYLKLVSVLFPTSDFRHSVTTPSMLFLGQILAICPVRSLRDVAVGLFVCNLFTQYISAAKRFVPELVNYLQGLLFLASDKPHTMLPNDTRAPSSSVQSLADYRLVPPFRPVGKHTDLLRLSCDKPKITRKISITRVNIAETLSMPLNEISEELNTDEFRIWALSLTLHLLCELSTLYQHLSSFREIFEPILQCLESERLPLHRYPHSIQTLCDTLKENLRAKDGVCRKWLQRERKRPQPIKMLEPLIEEDYDPTRKKKVKGNKQLNEKQRLVHRHRKEMKGAIREIRKDAHFLAKHKLKEQLQKDAERKQRVKEIHHLLGTQEGEFKAMERKKGKF